MENDMSHPQNIKIVSDGTAQGTKVLLPDGKQMPGLITKISFEIEAMGRCTATITFSGVECDVLADLPDDAA